jgi:hypothetical protein
LFALLLLLVGATGLLLAAAGACRNCNSSWALTYKATCAVGAAVAAVGFGAAGASASHWLFQLCMLLLMQANCACLAGLQSQDSRSRCNDTAGMAAAAAAEQDMPASHMADMAALTRVQWWTAVSVHVSCSA